MKKNGGGYRQGSGRGKKGWYRGYFCDSSYELAYVIYNIDHSIKFSRNTQKFPYEFEGCRKHWIPDFILEDGTFVEVKGYETPQVLAKINSFPSRLIYLKQKDMSHIFEYVIAKYGKDFITLYESKV